MLVLSGKDRRYLDANRDFYEKSRKKIGTLASDLKRVFDVWTESMLMNLFSRCNDDCRSMLERIDYLMVKSPIDCIKTISGNEGMSDEEFLQNGAEEVGNIDQARLIIQQIHQTLPILKETLSTYFSKFFKEEWTTEILPKLREECEAVKDELERPEIDVIEVMEDFVGKRSPIYLIKVSPSLFIPRHSGYGIKEDGTMAIVYGSQVARLRKGNAVKQIARMASHEVLHKVINNPPLWNNPHLKNLFEDWLTRNQHYVNLYKTKFKQYGKEGFFEENLVIAISYIISEKLHLLSETSFVADKDIYLKEGYPLVPCFYDEFRVHYDRHLYSNIDEFIVWMFINNKTRTV